MDDALVPNIPIREFYLYKNSNSDFYAASKPEEEVWRQEFLPGLSTLGKIKEDLTDINVSGSVNSVDVAVSKQQVLVEYNKKSYLRPIIIGSLAAVICFYNTDAVNRDVSQLENKAAQYMSISINSDELPTIKRRQDISLKFNSEVSLSNESLEDLLGADEQVKTESSQSVRTDEISVYQGLFEKQEKNPSYFRNLDKKQTDYLLVVDKATQTSQVYRLTIERVDETKVSTGKNPGSKERQGDFKTPDGLFTVVDQEKSSAWVHNGKKGEYGNYFSRLDAGSWDANGNYSSTSKSSIGVHGTSHPDLLGNRASEGCIRLDNSKNDLYVKSGYLKKGTLVAILPETDDK